MTDDRQDNKASTTARSMLLGLDQDMEIDIRGLLLMLWRRKMVVISVMLIGLSFATIAMTFMAPRYTAKSLILIEANAGQNKMEEFQTLLNTVRLDTSLILSELEVLRSRSMGRKVVEKLNLMTDPEFNPRFKRAMASKKDGKNGAEFKNLSVYRSELESLPPEMADREIAVVVSRFLEGLEVRSIPGSFAIQVEYTSLDPGKAALIANAVVDTYIEQRLEAKFKATKKLTDWLDKRLSNLRKQVRTAESAVEKYRATHDLAEGTRTIMSAEQISELNSQLVLAKAQRAEAQARMEQIQGLVNGSGRLDTAVEIVNSDLIQRLKLDKVSLEKRLSELLTRYGDKHPEILKTRSELEELNEALRGEMVKISKNVESEVNFAEARVSALEEGLDQAQGKRFEDSAAMIQLRALEREAASTRLIFDTFLETYKRSDEQDELQEAEARIISYAIVPRAPSYPNKMLLLSLSAAISLFIGLAIAILLEKLDNTYRSANQLENSLNFPCYALIPAMEGMQQRELAKYIMTKPSSTIAESVRTLRMVLNLRPPNTGEKPKVVTITSSFPGEGKTTMSVWLGRLTAKSGEKVIIIDADLRRPNVHRCVGKANDVSLVEYLTGQKELDEVIQKDDASGCHMILGRSVPNSALDLVSSGKMKKLVASLKQVYDLVIIDSPACLAVSDARVLATISDQTIYAVAWDRTPREVVASGVKQFSDMGYENLAFILTNVDVKRHVRYGYGDTVYYYGRYKEYYAD